MLNVSSVYEQTKQHIYCESDYRFSPQFAPRTRTFKPYNRGLHLEMASGKGNDHTRVPAVLNVRSITHPSTQISNPLSGESELSWLADPVDEVELVQKLKDLREAKRKRTHNLRLADVSRNMRVLNRPSAKKQLLISDRLSQPKRLSSESHLNLGIYSNGAPTIMRPNESVDRLSAPQSFEAKFSRYISSSLHSNHHATELSTTPPTPVAFHDLVLPPSQPDLKVYQSSQVPVSMGRSRRTIMNDQELAADVKTICHRIIALAEKYDSAVHRKLDNSISEMIATFAVPRVSLRHHQSIEPELWHPCFPRLSESLNNVIRQRPTRLYLLRLCHVASSLKRA